jgi:hypothetical protein
VTVNEMNRLLDLLAKLSEDGSLTGHTRDSIGVIRSAVQTKADEKERDLHSTRTGGG